MTESDLRQEMISGLHGVYLLCGEETYLMAHRGGDIRKLILGDDASLASFNHIYFEGDIEPDDLQNASLSMPMMASQLLIEWQEAPIDSWKEQKRDRIFSLFAEMNERTDLVVLVLARQDLFDCGTEKKPSAKFVKLEKTIHIVRFEKQTEAKLAKWMIKHFSSEDLSIEARVPYEIMQVCGQDMYRLSNEINKLCFYAKAKQEKTITVSMVHEIASPSPEENAFGLADAITSGNRSQALNELYYHKIAREEPLIVLSKISKTICDMLSVSQLRDAGKNVDDIAKVLHLHAFVAKKYYTAVSRIGTDRLALAVNACRKCDREMKRGMNTYALLEKLICSLPQAR